MELEVNKAARRLLSSCSETNCPVLLVGPSGVGKSFMIENTARSQEDAEVFRIYGSLTKSKDSIAANRGESKKDVHGERKNLKEFLKGRFSKSRKVVLVHDVDNMMDDAQCALKSIMEESYSEDVQYLMTATDVDKLEDSLFSILLVCRTELLTDEEVSTVIQEYLSPQKVSLELIQYVKETCQYDLRRIQGFCKVLKHAIETKSEEAEQLRMVSNVMSLPSQVTIEKLLRRVSRGEDIFESVSTELVQERFTVFDVSLVVISVLLSPSCLQDVSDRVKYNWLKKTSELVSKMTSTMTPIHMYSLFSVFS